MKNDYTYAVARIRVREQELLSRADIEQLRAVREAEDILRFLAERGWGDGSGKQRAEELLAWETRKSWALMEELLEDVSVLSVLRIPADYHNLKAAVKLCYTKAEIAPERLFEEGGNLDPALLQKCAEEREFHSLPEPMARAAAEASDALLHTGDGQICDRILDRASLEAVYEAGRASREPVLKAYAALAAAAADIRIAARCGRCGKSLEFLISALVPLEELQAEGLARSALEGEEALAEYLVSAGFGAAAEALLVSDAAFEKWYRDQIIRLIRPQKANPFTAGPLAAYLLAREQEIWSVRMILTVKQNGLPEELLQERLGEMYV